MNQKPISLIRKFKKYTYGEILISSITVSELEYGVAKSKYLQQNQQRLDEFLMPLNIIPYDEHAAKVYGKIRAQLEKKGQVIGPLDMLIAAHALSLSLTIVTNNDREFKRITDLTVENWLTQYK